MKKYGLIGYPLSHSFSKFFFEKKFTQENILDTSYDNFPLETLFNAKHYLTNEQGLSGFNVTIPHKKNIISLLDDISPEVKATGACNCVRIENGEWHGFNTDVIGFRESLIPLLQPYHQKALILGTGGAAQAAAYVLDGLNISYLFVSRNKTLSDVSYGDINASVLAAYFLIINTSPVGMYPNIDACPAIPYQLLTPQHCLFDLIYNPAETVFLRKGIEQNAMVKNGHEMLVIQAVASWEIWNSNL